MTMHTCPSCGSQEVSRNGLTRHGKQNYKCRDCGRQFVLDPVWKAITPEQYGLIDRMLLERVSLAGIARILQISEDTVQRYVNTKAAVVPQQVRVREKPKKRLNVQMDELWSFVDEKGNEQWIWLAIDAQTREIVGIPVGDRPECGIGSSVVGLDATGISEICSDFTDHWSAYRAVLPKQRHRSVDKDSGLVSYIERFNCTLRQRVSRLVRKSLSFSKKLDNHIAAIWNFVHHYNATRRRKLGLA